MNLYAVAWILASVVFPAAIATAWVLAYLKHAEDKRMKQ